MAACGGVWMDREYVCVRVHERSYAGRCWRLLRASPARALAAVLAAPAAVLPGSGKGTSVEISNRLTAAITISQVPAAGAQHMYV